MQVPTSPHTPPDERGQLSSAIYALALAVDGLPRRLNRRREGEEELKQADWLDEEGERILIIPHHPGSTHPPGIRLWNFAFSADYKMNNGLESAKEDRHARCCPE